MTQLHETIGVLGAGTMGNGIAHVFARAGFTVLLSDISPDAIARGLADIPSPPTQPYLNAACKSLINAANQHGGRDNITVLLLAFPQGVERRKPRRPESRL